MKVLSVVESLGHGGAESVLVDLALGLREHEHRVAHFSGANRIAAHDGFVATLARRSIDVFDVHWSALGERTGRAEVMRDFRPDVVVFHWWGNDPWRRWLASAADGARDRRPLFVLVLHHAHYAAPAGYDRYVLVSESQRPQVAHLSPERVRVIPNGVDLRRFARRRRRRSHREMVVGRVSSLRSGKIPPDWVDTLVSFGLRGARWVVAGDGPARGALARRAAEIGFEDRVAFPGYVPRAEVGRALETFDVFCYATSTAVECHPLALLESLACGVPIVAEARGGVPEIVTHGVNGLLAATTDELGEHLHHVQRDHALRARLGRGARASAARFSLPRQLDAYRALLAELACTRDGRRRGAWHE